MNTQTLSRALLAGAALAALTAATGEAKVSIEKIEYYGQPNCYLLTNGRVDVIVTTDVGPRIIAYRFTGGQNILSEMPFDEVVRTELGDWRPMGGHRLWHAPEGVPRSYSPDNDPVEVEVSGDTVTLTQKVEPATGIQKQIAVTLAPQGSRVTVRHTLTNRGLWPVELAPWALTIVRPGGEQVIPQEPYISHDEKKLPARPLVLWNYTDLSDSRLKLGRRFIRVTTDPANERPTKLGVLNTLGWTAYQVDGALFIKRYPYADGARYPDMGCNYETFTKGTFLELESLGPLARLEPGESATHTERWYLFPAVRFSADDDELAAALAPVIAQTVD